MNGNERYHSTDALQRMSGTVFLNVQITIPEDLKEYNYLNDLVCGDILQPPHKH